MKAPSRCACLRRPAVPIYRIGRARASLPILPSVLDYSRSSQQRAYPQRLAAPPDERFPNKRAFWALPTELGRPSAPPFPAPTAGASRTSRTFSRQARCQTRTQGNAPAWREGAQSLCTFRTQRKRNRTTYLSSFPKKTSPSRRTRLREAESRRRLKL